MMQRVRLVPIPAEDLPALARGLVAASVRANVIADGLPPPEVAERIQRRLAAGKPAFWVGMFYIVAEDGCCVGGCGFKDVPQAREVEIGYGLAAARRGHGYASAALAELLRMAAASGEVESALLRISRENLPSIKVAERAGFSPGAEDIGEDGDLTVRWTRRVLPAISG